MLHVTVHTCDISSTITIYWQTYRLHVKKERWRGYHSSPKYHTVIQLFGITLLDCTNLNIHTFAPSLLIGFSWSKILGRHANNLAIFVNVWKECVYSFKNSFHISDISYLLDAKLSDLQIRFRKIKTHSTNSWYFWFYITEILENVVNEKKNVEREIKFRRNRRFTPTALFFWWNWLKV
jgi:hypothetical protein